MDERKRILVVDDDPNALAGLQRVLRSLRKEWEMVFIEGPQEALRRLSLERFHVVLSSLHMTGMNGDEFLRQVKQAHPETVRMILSGLNDEEGMIRCLGVCHQFIAKPCDPDVLKSVIVQSGTLTDHFTNDKVAGFLAGVDSLPRVPATYREVCALLDSDGVSPERLAKTIERDPVMASTLLRVVNSPYFGRSRKLVSLAEAVFFLGTESIRSLVLNTGLFREVGSFEHAAFNVGHLWAHSVQVAAGARRIAELEGASKEVKECCFTGGLLHDVGILVLASRFPEDYERVTRFIQVGGATLPAAEHEVFGVTHGEVGAYLLSLWALPEETIRPVAWHHLPSFESVRAFSPTLAVHAADALAGKDGHHQVFGTAALDLLYLKAIGLGDRTEVWRQALAEP